MSGSSTGGGWRGSRRRGDQVGIRCVVMRGGTSRGALLRADDLPADPRLRERVILAIYGSPDIRQIDGIGGANPLTSKVAVVGRSSRDDADVDFLFGQVRLSEPKVDFAGNCGNMTAAIAPYAVDEGLVAATDPVTEVRIHLVNTHAVVTARVAVDAGMARVEGDCEIPGVPGSGAPIWLDFGGASALGRGLLPTGQPRDQLQTHDGPVEVSIVDAANPVVFVAPDEVGLRGTELPVDFTPELLRRLETVRAAGAVRLGLVANPDDAAAVTPAIPKLYCVAPATDYVDMRGRGVSADAIDVVGRGLSMGVPHQAYAGTVAICTAVAGAIPGTLVYQAARSGGRELSPRFRIGHPSGAMTVEAEVDGEGSGLTVRRAAIERTARRILEGIVYVPRSRLQDAPEASGTR